MARGLAGGLLGLGLAAAALTLFVTVVRQAPGLSGAVRPDDVLLVLLGWVGLLLAAWLALGSLLAVAATDDTVEVVDLKSTNGTYVNGKRVTKARLAKGDRLRVGRVELTISRQA